MLQCDYVYFSMTKACCLNVGKFWYYSTALASQGNLSSKEPCTINTQLQKLKRFARIAPSKLKAVSARI